MPKHPNQQPVDPAVPVPVNVLLPRPAGSSRHVPASPASGDPYGLAADTAAVLVANYTSPGDRVAVLDDSTNTRKAVAQLDRRLVTDFTDCDRDGVRLMLAVVPRPDRDARTLATLVSWMSVCQTRLVPGGHLVACVPADGPDGRYADHASDVLAAAASVGLSYQQHLIAVHTPLAATEPRAEHRHGGPRPPLVGRRHSRVHSDLFVVAKAVTADA
ncbi:hypothetical protein [Pilimelia terevasa]|nr:hypothetical protein [Pilimelia terevasa]